MVALTVSHIIIILLIHCKRYRMVSNGTKTFNCKQKNSIAGRYMNLIFLSPFVLFYAIDIRMVVFTVERTNRFMVQCKHCHILVYQ